MAESDNEIVKSCVMPNIIRREAKVVKNIRTDLDLLLDILEEAGRKNGLRFVSMVDGYSGKELYKPIIGQTNWIVRRAFLIGYITIAKVSITELTIEMQSKNKRMINKVVEMAKEFERKTGKKMTIIIYEKSPRSFKN